MKRHRGGPSGNTTRLTLPKGLTREEATRAATRKVGGDWRGFVYDPKTGKASVT